MPKQRRIRNDHDTFELRSARVFVARKNYECCWCTTSWRDVVVGLVLLPTRIPKGATYARISETRIPVCSMHFTPDDVEVVSRG